MTISEKSRFKKNKCIQLAAIATSLTLGQVSGENISEEYTSPAASFLSEHCSYPIDCAVEKEFASPSGGSS